MSFKNLKCQETTILVPETFEDDNCKDFFSSIRVDDPDRWDYWTRPFNEEKIAINKESLVGSFKFVLCEIASTKEKFAIIFSGNITHSYLAEVSSELSDEFSCPVSAGFVEISENSVRVYGRSETLDMDSNENDSKPYIEKLLFGSQ